MEECGIDLESLYTKADKNLADLCDRVPVHMVESRNTKLGII
jgi:hypothetical protein